ncbi:MAG TPA: type II secretion system F family protein, partial [archaeon]|nr:type II secretion system F family protein [archaeon]
MKFEKGLLKTIAISVVISIPIVVINFFLFRDNQIFFSSINIVAVLIFAGPIALKRYMQYKKIKEMEEMFILFLKDFVEAIRGGMTIPNAFKSVSINDYKALNPYVKRMSAQMNWGIPVDKVFINFSKSSKSKLIAKIVSSVIESHRFGGNLAESFDALSNTSLEIERLRSERSLYLH